MMNDDDEDGDEGDGDGDDDDAVSCRQLASALVSSRHRSMDS